VTDLLAKVVAKDLAGVTAGVANVVADLQALLLAAPQLITGAPPLPVQPPLDDQGQQFAPEAPPAPQGPAVSQVP
jgi:hypothetical protein